MRCGWEADIFLHFTSGSEQLESTVFTTIETVVLLFNDNWGGYHITGSEGFFVLLVGENVFACNHGLS